MTSPSPGPETQAPPAPPAVDPHRRERALWFLAVNVMSLVIAAAVFVGVLYGDGLSALFEPVLTGIYEYKLIVILIATSPLLASLLVGMAYAQRSIRRKKAAQAEAMAQAQAASRAGG